MTPNPSKIFVGIAAAIALACSSAAMAAAPKYKLEVVRGDGAMAPPSLIVGINDQGTMIGQINNWPSQFNHTLARYTGARSAAELLTDSTNIDASDINAAGDVLAGKSGQSFIWRQDGSRVTLPLSFVWAFNNSDWVTGWLGVPVVWHDGAATPLESVDGGSVAAMDINNAGISVGNVGYAVGDKHFTDAAIWDTAGKLQRLSVPGSTNSYGSAINTQGHVVGTSTGGESCGFIFDGAQAQCLPKVSGRTVWDVVTINDRDEVLCNDGPDRGPVLWRKGAGYLLRDLLEDHGKDWLYLKAYGMNNAGQIVGWGNYKGKDRGFVAKRVK